MGDARSPYIGRRKALSTILGSSACLELQAAPHLTEQRHMPRHHELLQDTLAQVRNVMCATDVRSPYVFRGKRNFRSRFLRDVIADHRVETAETGNLAKVDLLSSPHALGKRGLFENVEMKMERAVALKKLGKILGKSMGYQVDLKAPDKDDRAEALAKLKEERPVKEAIKKQMEAREAEILKADAEYQRLKAEYADARKRCDELSHICNRYRFTVGIMGQLFFSVRAQGDSWEEVIALVEKDRRPMAVI